jgi:DNA polymerase-3 subunit beta
MTFTTFTQNLVKAFGIAERSCGKSLHLPIINYILVAVEKNKLKLSATDLEQGVILEILGKTEDSEKIAVAIPAKMTGEFLRSIKSEKVVLTIDAKSLKIESNGQYAAIQGLSAEDFPVIPKSSGPLLFKIPGTKFAQALTSVAVAAAHSDIRAELGGVYFEWNPKAPGAKLVIAATDSFRLAEYNFEGEVEFKIKEGSGSCILPLRAVQEAARIAQESGGELEFSISETQFGMKWPEGEFVSRLLEGSFPNYRTIIPQKFRTEINCRRRALLDLIRQAGLFSSKINDIKLSVTANNRELKIKSGDAAKGEYEGKIECAVSGEDLFLAFNYQFLVDGLERIESDEILLGLNDSNSPALLRPLDARVAYRYIVMPLRV